MKVLVAFLLPVLVLVAALLGAFAIFAGRPEPEIRSPELLAPLVRVQEVEKRDLRLTVSSQGTVAPRTESQLVPEVSGRVLRVADDFVEGGFFEAGEVLLKIDPYDYDQAVVQARARIAEATLRLAREEAEAEVARREWKELGRGDANPLTLREPQVAEARASLEAARAALERAERDRERTVVRAPYAGRVREKRVDVGQFVNRGEPLGRIYAVDEAEVRLPLPDAELAYLRDLPLAYRNAAAGSGPEVILRAEFAGGTHEWRGRIVRSEGEIDRRSRMVHLVARVDDPYRRDPDARRPPLAVGMFVEAEILGRHVEGVVVLPRGALHGGNQVWIVDGDDRLRFREVQVLRTEGERVLIAGGLEEGERVCLSSMEAVTDGMRVRPGPAEREGET